MPAASSTTNRVRRLRFGGSMNQGNHKLRLPLPASRCRQGGSDESGTRRSDSGGGRVPRLSAVGISGLQAGEEVQSGSIYYPNGPRQNSRMRPSGWGGCCRSIMPNRRPPVRWSVGWHRRSTPVPTLAVFRQLHHAFNGSTRSTFFSPASAARNSASLGNFARGSKKIKDSPEG